MDFEFSEEQQRFLAEGRERWGGEAEDPAYELDHALGVIQIGETGRRP